MRKEIPDWLKSLSWIVALGYTMHYFPFFFLEDAFGYKFMAVFLWVLSVFLYYLDRGNKS